MKRVLALILALVCMLASFTAMAEGKLISDEPVTLKLTVEELSVAGASYADNLPVFQAIEERTGVKIEWEVIPAEYKTVMSTRLASLMDLPDIIAYSGNASTVINSGAIIPLDELVAEHAPNLTAFLAANPDIAATLYGPDGKLWFLPGRTISMEGLAFNPGTFIVRYDWMQKCGIEDYPETIDDWYKLLTAFRTMDPNGNGEQDEEGYVNTASRITAFASAWGIDWMNPYYVDDNGKVQYAWATEATYDFLSTMAKWYAEGLIAPDYLSVTNMDTRLPENKAGSTFLNASSNCGWHNDANPNEGCDWRPVAPPKNVYTGEDGFLPVNTGERLGDYKMAVSSTCVDPVVAVKWLDFMYSAEGLRFTNAGVEGVSYTVAEDGSLIYADEYFKGSSAYENRKKFGIEPSGTIPHQLMSDYFNGVGNEYPAMILEMAKPMGQYFRAALPVYAPTEEEDAILSAVQTDITTYAEEMIHKFIIGTESLEGYEDYVKKINAIGLSDVLAIKQAQYDRNNK